MRHLIRRTLTCSLAASLLITLSAPSFAWQLEPTDESSNVKVWTEVMPSSSFKAFKGEIVINADIQTVFKVITDTANYPKWYHNSKEARTLKKLNDKQSLSYSITSAPWPVSNRDSVTLSTKNRLENGDYLIELKAQPDAYPRQKGLIRIEKMEGYWKLEQQAAEQTKVTLQITAEPGGDLPSWLANSTVVEMPFNSLTNLKVRIEGKY